MQKRSSATSVYTAAGFIRVQRSALSVEYRHRRSRVSSGLSPPHRVPLPIGRERPVAVTLQSDSVTMQLENTLLQNRCVHLQDTYLYSQFCLHVLLFLETVSIVTVVEFNVLPFISIRFGKYTFYIMLSAEYSYNETESQRE